MTDIVVGSIAALALILGAVIGAPRLLKDPVNSIVKQTEIYNALPESSPAKAAILERIEQQVNGLDTEASARRNPYGIFWSVIFIILGAAAGWFVVSTGGWWWIGSPIPFVLLLAGFIALGQSATKVPRAANGQSLEYQRRRVEKAAAKAAPPK